MKIYIYLFLLQATDKPKILKNYITSSTTKNEQNLNLTECNSLYGEYGITDRLTAGYILFSNKTATKQLTK
jgi:hypothetical protein